MSETRDVASPGGEPQDTQVFLDFTPADEASAGVDGLAFTEYLTALIRALHVTAAEVSHQRLDVTYDIVSISTNSPIHVVLDAKARNGSREIAIAANDVFAETVAQIARGEALPSTLTHRQVEAYHRVGEASKRSGLAAAVRTRSARAVVRPRLSERLAIVLEDDVEVDGTFEGYLQLLNVRGAPRVKVYPRVGPHIIGRIPRKLVPKAKAAVDEYVVVEGTLIYRPYEDHPRRIRVRDIVSIERQGSEPYFQNLWGAGHDYKPERSSMDLITEMRRAW